MSPGIWQHKPAGTLDDMDTYTCTHWDLGVPEGAQVCWHPVSSVDNSTSGVCTDTSASVFSSPYTQVHVHSCVHRQRALFWWTLGTCTSLCEPTPAGHGVYTRPPHLNLSPLPSPEVAPGAAAQEATGRVGTAVAAGAALSSTLVHILAAPEGLVEVKARGADAAEASKRVVAGGAAAGRGRQCTLVLVHTLGPLGMWGEALGAAAAVAPQLILTAVLAVMWLITFIHICTAMA